MNFDKDQLKAIQFACENKFTFIAGGAGTGKTTLIKSIAQQLAWTCDVCAPTGKAAARLKECGVPATTIHSWLGWQGESFFREQAHKPLIIDESSMLDSMILSYVIKCKPPKIILVGDASQLLPVGKGSPFADLMAMYPENTVELTTCYRNKAAVHAAAYQIRNGSAPSWDDTADGEIWKMQNTGNGQQTTQKLISWIKSGTYDPETDMILACQNGESATDHGTIAGLNAAIVDVINPRDGDEAWKVGDRIMNTKNFNQDDWYNGDTGTIDSIDQGGNIWVSPDRDREGGDIRLDRDMLRSTVLAYALTVHKSQGSQFRHVFFVVLNRNSHMISRSLVYTAVTRAQRGCVVMGEIESFMAGVNRTNKKNTVMQKLHELNEVVV